MTPTEHPLRYAFVALTTPDHTITRFELTFADGIADETGSVKLPVPAPAKGFDTIPTLLRWLADNCEAIDAEEQ